MLKKVFFASLLLGSLIAEARTLSPEEALDRVFSDSQTSSPAKVRSATRTTESRKLVRTTLTTLDGEPAVYSFDLTDKGSGYMIVSADDLAYPLLGYSDSGSLDGEIPPALEWLLSEYAAQIEYARTHNADAKVSIARATANRDPIAPLIETSWDQGAPYNNSCPTYGTEPTYTGCVATAMAQVMNYWQYPLKGKGSVSYNAASVQKRLSIDFSLKKFDWDNMIRTYSGSYTEEQAAAVAYLMKACGYSVKMDYGTDSSGALAMAVPYAFVKYFDYDPSILHEVRALYTASEWETKLYENLRDCGPIMYGGGSLIGGGHSFICDGYDGNGYFHFNWGWTGMSDGYFSIDALNPYALGAGGGGGGGYNFTQDAVFNIRPNTGEEVEARPITLVQHGSLAAFMKDGNVVFDLYAESQPMWVNYNYSKLHLTFGALVEKPGDDSFDPICVSTTDKWFEIDGGYGTGPAYFENSFNPDELDLTDGTYKVSVMIRHEGSDEYIHVRPCSGYSDYIYLTKNGSDYEIGIEDCWRLEVTEAEIVGAMYYGLATKYTLTVTNDSPIEMTRGFAPCVLTTAGEISMLGESIFLTVPAGETVTREVTTEMYQLDQYFSVSEDTEMVFTLFDESTYNLWSDDILKKIIVHPNPGIPSMTAAAPKVDNALSSDRLMRQYTVDNTSDIQVSCKVTLQQGVFGYPMYACIVANDGSGSLYAYNGQSVYMDSDNNEYEFTTSVNFPEAVPGEKYLLMMGYAYGSYLTQIGTTYSTITIAESAGIDDVEADEDSDAPVEYYNLQGIRVANPERGGVYIRRQGSKTEKMRL